MLVLDLRAVGFMDTSGLRLVISQQRRAEAGGYRFVVVPGSAKIQRLFEIAGFPTVTRCSPGRRPSLPVGDAG